MPITLLRDRLAMLEAEGREMRQTLADVDRARIAAEENCTSLRGQLVKVREEHAAELATCTAERRALILTIDHLVRAASRETIDVRSSVTGAKLGEARRA